MIVADRHIRIGTDVQSIAEVEASIAQFGDRYVRRIFTDHEVAACGGITTLAAPGLAARFAAKEATIKLLRPTTLVPAWRSIELRTRPGGAVEVCLHDEAADLAREARLGELSVSLSHGAGVGMATVVALAEPPRTPLTTRES